MSILEVNCFFKTRRILFMNKLRLKVIGLYFLLGCIIGFLDLTRPASIVLIATILMVVIGKLLLRSPIGRFIQTNQSFKRVNFNISHIHAAIWIQLLITSGSLIFVVPRAHNILSALGYGLFFGLIIDGTIFLYNYVAIESYSVKATNGSIPFSILLISLMSGFIYWLNTIL